VGAYLAAYLSHLGIADVFIVPGDYNLTLLDELQKPIAKEVGFGVAKPPASAAGGHQEAAAAGRDAPATQTHLNLINCCNELNCGYAADGYARVRGIGAFVVTQSVGALSCVNAVAGAFAEGVPLIVSADAQSPAASCNCCFSVVLACPAHPCVPCACGVADCSDR